MSVVVGLSNSARYSSTTALTEITATTPGALVTYQAEGMLSILLVHDLHKLPGKDTSEPVPDISRTPHTDLLAVATATKSCRRDGDNVVAVLVDFAACAQADLEERTLYRHL